MLTSKRRISFIGPPSPVYAPLILLTSVNQLLHIHLFLESLKKPLSLSLSLIALCLFLVCSLPCLLSHTLRFLHLTCSPSALTCSHLFAYSINFLVNTPGHCCQSVHQRAVVWKTNHGLTGRCKICVPGTLPTSASRLASVFEIKHAAEPHMYSVLSIKTKDGISATFSKCVLQYSAHLAGLYAQFSTISP